MQQMGKFDDPEPDFVPPINVVELRTMEDAVKLLDQWAEAYAELRHEYAVLHALYVKVLNAAAMHKTSARSYETLYEAALTGDDELRGELLTMIRDKA